MKRAIDFKTVPGKKSRAQPRVIFLEKWGHQRFPGISVSLRELKGKGVGKPQQGDKWQPEKIVFKESLGAADMIKFDSQMKLGSNLSPVIQCRMMLRYLIFTNSRIFCKTRWRGGDRHLRGHNDQSKTQRKWPTWENHIGLSTSPPSLRSTSLSAVSASNKRMWLCKGLDAGD